MEMADAVGDFGNESRVSDLVDEIRRHRSALAADRERVRSVVREAMTQAYANGRGLNSYAAADLDAIATRAAEQLATALVGLSEEDRVRLRNIADLLRKQPVCWDMEAALLDRLLGATK